MYAISLSSGQSIYLPRYWGESMITTSAAIPGSTLKAGPNTFSSTGTLTVVLSAQQYYDVLPQTTTATGTRAVAGTTYTDISVPSLSVMDIALPASGQIVAGRCSYVGFSVKETTGTATASVVLSDSAGSLVEEINLAANESAREFYTQETKISPSGGIAINGVLQISSSTGTFAGVIRVVER